MMSCAVTGRFYKWLLGALEGTQILGEGNTGRLLVEFDITPLAGFLNACTGYADSSTGISTWNDLSMTIRMNNMGTDAGEAAAWLLEGDVTSYINSQMTDKLVSIELKNGGTAFISFNSREASSNKPELIITPQ